MFSQGHGLHLEKFPLSQSTQWLQSLMCTFIKDKLAHYTKSQAFSLKSKLIPPNKGCFIFWGQRVVVDWRFGLALAWSSQRWLQHNNNTNSELWISSLPLNFTLSLKWADNSDPSLIIYFLKRISYSCMLSNKWSPEYYIKQKYIKSETRGKCE